MYGAGAKPVGVVARGLPPEFQMARLAPRVVYDEMVVSASVTAKKLKLHGLLRALKAALPHVEIGIICKLRDGGKLLGTEFENWLLALDGDGSTDVYEASLQWLRKVAGLFKAKVVALARARSRKWRTELQVFMKSPGERKNVFALCKEDKPIMSGFVVRPDGTITGDPEVILADTKVAWDGIYRYWETHEAPEDQDFVTFFAGEIAAVQGAVTLPDLDPFALEGQAKSRKTAAKPGCDGWRTCEVKAWPNEAWALLCAFLKFCEQHAWWPQALCHAAVVMIPKTGGLLGPLAMRPITLCSMIYLVWSGLRNRQLKEWAVDFFPAQIAGGLPERGTHTLLVPFVLELEEKALSRRNAAGKDFFLGALYDKSKCFDLVIPRLAKLVLSLVGLPHGMVGAYYAFVTQLKRFFVLGKWCGRQWTAYNSVLQGDSLSILVINVFHWFLFQKLMRDTPAVSPTCYIDDLGLRATWSNRTQLRLAHDITMQFQRVAAFVDNADKAVIWTEQPRAVSWLRKLCPAAKISKIPLLLGLDLPVSQQGVAASKALVRAKVALQRLTKIAALPLTFADKAIAVQAVAIPCLLYLVECYAPTFTFLRGPIRTRACDCIFGHQRTFRCKEIVLALLCKGHLADPLQAVIYRTVMNVRRVLVNDTRLHALWHRVVSLRLRSPGRGGQGIVCRLIASLKQLGWALGPDFLIVRGDLPPIHLLQGSNGWFGHLVRSQLIDCTLAEATRKRLKGKVRTDIQGLINCDVTLSLALYRHAVGIPKIKLVMREVEAWYRTHFHTRGAEIASILAGCTPTMVRLCSAGLVQSARCPLGCQEDELVSHWLVCPAWRHLRPPPVVVQELLSAKDKFPPCFWECGLMPKHLALRKWEVYLAGTELVLPPWQDKSATDFDVYTDGCCVGWPGLRACGAGVYVVGHPELCQHFCVPGFEQSNQRAELYALIAAMRLVPGSATLHTDSQWCFDKFHLLFNYAEYGGWAHADLWHEARAVLDRVGPDGFRLRKVKAHLTAVHVALGLITEADRAGNAEADRLAARGAALHPTFPEIEEYYNLVPLVLYYQAFLVLVSKARAAFVKADRAGDSPVEEVRCEETLTFRERHPS